MTLKRILYLNKCLIFTVKVNVISAGQLGKCDMEVVRGSLHLRVFAIRFDCSFQFYVSRLLKWSHLVWVCNLVYKTVIMLLQYIGQTLRRGADVARVINKTSFLGDFNVYVICAIHIIINDMSQNWFYPICHASDFEVYLSHSFATKYNIA